MTIKGSQLPNSPTHSPKQQTNEAQNVKTKHNLADEVEVDELQRLDEMINRPRWVVPVLPKQELEILLDVTVQLCKQGLDTKCEHCQRFIRESLMISFTKILTDEAVSTWKYDIYRCIYNNTLKAIDLCVLKLSDDSLPLLELLAMIMHPQSKFNTSNHLRPPEIIIGDDEFMYARSLNKPSYGWLVDFINYFGRLNGFKILLDRFTKGPKLTIQVIAALLKPWGFAYDFLTPQTVKTYFLEILELVPKVFESLSDEDIKKECKSESKNDSISTVIKWLKHLATRVPDQNELCKNLEVLRLKTILKILKFASFNGKMNALNEVNKLITNISYTNVQMRRPDEDEWLTSERMAKWIQENDVLDIVLRDCMHQPQYVEKLEKILRFLIKEKSLTLKDLDKIWESQLNKHEAIEKNVHDLLCKLAWDFTPEQLDHLFSCFQKSWTNASKKQREKLLDLIRSLSEDDKEGVMASKVLDLLWNLAHSDDAPNDIIEQAIIAHIKILDYSCSQDKEAQKLKWLEKCIEQLKDDKWIIISIKHIREILQQYQEVVQNNFHINRMCNTTTTTTATMTSNGTQCYYRHDVITKLQKEYSLISMITANLSNYYDKIRALVTESSVELQVDPDTILPDGRFNHTTQIQERLNFMKYLLKEGQLWLCASQAECVWKCLAQQSVFECDRENCFRWFSKLMTEDPDLEPDMNKTFFESYVTQLDPKLLTDSGIKCFERFFKTVNLKCNRLVQKRHFVLTESLDLIGLDYLWKIVTFANEEVAEKAILILKEIYIHLGPQLKGEQSAIHNDFISNCMDRLRVTHDKLTVINQQTEADILNQEIMRILRVMTVLKEYLYEFDSNYLCERVYAPLCRAYRGKSVVLVVRIALQNRQNDELEFVSHSNDTIGSIRRQIYQRSKLNPQVKIDLILNNECVECSEDNKILGEYQLKEKMLIIAKISQNSNCVGSSPESSSDDGSGDDQQQQQHNVIDSPKIECELGLPSVILSRNEPYIQFIIQLADFGCVLRQTQITEYARDILDQIPAAEHIIERIRQECKDCAVQQQQLKNHRVLDDFYFNCTPTNCWYNLKVTYCLLVPSIGMQTDETKAFQETFIKAGGVPCAMNMLVKDTFLSGAHDNTKKATFYYVLKINKLTMTTLCYAIYLYVVNSIQNKNYTAFSESLHEHAILLQNSVQSIPNSSTEITVRTVAQRLGQQFTNKLALSQNIIQIHHINRLQYIAWSIAASNTLDYIDVPYQELHEKLIRNEDVIENDNANVCREALEVLSLALSLLPGTLDNLNKEKHWHTTIYDLLLLCNNRFIRQSASEQFFLIALRCSSNLKALNFFIQMLFACLQTTVKDNSAKSGEYFQLLCRLLNCAYMNSLNMSNIETLLNNEINWLRTIKDTYLKESNNNNKSYTVDEVLLDGHLGITKELLSFQNSEKKYLIGSKSNDGLLNDLVKYFIFTSSYLYTKYKTNDQLYDEQFKHELLKPICRTQANLNNAYDLIVSLCTGCLENFNCIYDILLRYFYAEANGVDTVISEWEYLPPIGPRPYKGYVGLKNAGATCYMNSVLQQLFMTKSLRDKVLSIQTPLNVKIEDVDDDSSAFNLSTSIGPVNYNENRIVNNNNNNHSAGEGVGNESSSEEAVPKSDDDLRKEYNLTVFKHLQMIFGHLVEGQMQYYIPKGFWRQFRMFGERVNLREQHDAVEFYNSVIDCLDESCKALGIPQVCGQILGGTFADQKICKDCPHRYTREESFTLLSLDVKHSQRLTESLEQYVKGDLLEGPNAYYCEKCDKKIDTIKRTCIKKLPSVLVIQLKRFDYDWEREIAVKSNEYFEFPRDLDMRPYTVQGIAALEKEQQKSNKSNIKPENTLDSSNDEDDIGTQSCSYKLVGIVVHSGQANGGHYYSYIQDKNADDGEYHWYKFDDGDVTECKMDDEEMKNQCYGGDYTGEVYDNIMKRMAFKKQKRWWNAYILFYERVESQANSQPALATTVAKQDEPSHSKIPLYILKSVQKKNMKFLHYRNHFSVEYFQFIKKLSQCNLQYLIQQAATSGDSLVVQEPQPQQQLQVPQLDQLCLLNVKLIVKFLFSVCFRVKKTLRGPINDWYDTLFTYFKASDKIRDWFANYLLNENQQLISQYLIECPSTDIRVTFCKILVVYVHLCFNSVPQVKFQLKQQQRVLDVADTIVQILMSLIKRDTNEQQGGGGGGGGKHLIQYFQFFTQYASISLTECLHLIRLDVPLVFIEYALDEPSSNGSRSGTSGGGGGGGGGHNSSSGNQCSDLTKLYCVVATLLRCYDVSAYCTPVAKTTPNPYSHYAELKQTPTETIEFSPKLNDYICSRSTYIRRLLEEAPNLDDTVKLMKYLAWENRNFSTLLIGELLWMIHYHYSYELKPHLDLLFHILIIPDSCQTHRLLLAFHGIPNDKDGLFEIVTRSQNHYQKRAYQVIKMLTQLFSTSKIAHDLLVKDDEMKKRWKVARLWLFNEMEKHNRMYNLPNYNYYNATQSNETSQNYFLERTHSAKTTLDRALKICPIEENEIETGDTTGSDLDVNQNGVDTSANQNEVFYTNTKNNENEDPQSPSSFQHNIQ